VNTQGRGTGGNERNDKIDQDKEANVKRETNENNDQ
jgi:hypothetical protein